jgi:hypothetical protein
VPGNRGGPNHYEAAISFTKQPSLREMFHRVAQEERTLTVICGAGISLDCGLPTWNTLVDRMCENINNERIKNLVRNDSIDMMRKVDYIFGMCDGYGTQRNAMVRAALFKVDPASLPPGVLTLTLAALAEKLGSHLRIITTNFDDRLDLALAEHLDIDVAAMGLYQAADWWTAVNRGDVAVMHMHGLLAKETERLPLILSGTDFRVHADRVQTFMTEVINTTDTLFVGVSMTDPNLMGPLSRRDTSKDTKSFLLTVPDAYPGVEWRDAHEYANVRCSVLQEVGLRTILLKAYSQVAQVISELCLAVESPDEYMDDDGDIRYGTRLKRALEDAYEKLEPPAATRRKTDPRSNWTAGVHVADRLAEALEKPGGPTSIIASTTERWEDGFLEQHQIRRDEFRNERFGLFLWLRLFEKHRDPKYGIKLVGSSVEWHREEWSFNKVVDIEPGTEFYAAASLFHGKTLAKGGVPGSKWKSVIAMPLYLRHPDDGPGFLPIGAVTLSSTRDDCDPARHLQHGGDDRCRPSAITYFQVPQKDELMRAMHRAGLEAIYGPAPNAPV